MKMRAEVCAGCDKVSFPLRRWRNGKKYCNRCLEEIEAMSKERRD